MHLRTAEVIHKDYWEPKWEALHKLFGIQKAPWKNMLPYRLNNIQNLRIWDSRTMRMREVGFFPHILNTINLLMHGLMMKLAKYCRKWSPSAWIIFLKPCQSLMRFLKVRKKYLNELYRNRKLHFSHRCMPRSEA